MYLISPAFDDFVIENDGLDYVILKWCLSDIFKISLNDVLYNNLSPTQYAVKMIHYHGKDLLEVVKPYAWKKTLPKKVLESYLFDTLVRLAVFLRIAKFSKNPDPDFYKLFASASPFLLKVNNNSYSDYSGLGTFSRDISIYMLYGQQFFEDKNLEPLMQLSAIIGDALTCQWILYKPFWQKFLIHHPNNLILLRNFLHTYLVSRTLSDEELNDYFNITKEDLDSLLEDFVVLHLDDKPSILKAKEFFKRLSYHVDIVPDNFYYKTLLEGDFTLFNKMSHQERYSQLLLS